MKKTLILILTLTLTGCGTISKFTSLTPDERINLLKVEAVKILENNKDNVRRALVLAGMEALHRAVDDNERKEIANQMYAASVAFNSLATGKTVTSQQVGSVLDSFSEGTGSKSYVKWISDATSIWGGIYDQIKLSDNQQLGIDYLLIFSQAAQQVAESNQ